MTKTKISELPHKGFLAAMIILIIAGFIWTAVNTKNYQNPLVQWVVTIVASAGVAYISYRLAKDANAEEGGKALLKFGLTFALYFILVGVVGGAARENRITGIPKEVLIHANGYIPDPDAYIEFHKKVEGGSNKIDFDKETEDYIKENHKQPTWIVINGYTKDLTGWKQAHPNASTLPKTAG